MSLITIWENVSVTERNCKRQSSGSRFSSSASLKGISLQHRVRLAYTNMHSSQVFFLNPSEPGVKCEFGMELEFEAEFGFANPD